MAENTLQVKRALSTAARLAVVLALGEPCWDIDEGNLYIGDGATLGGVKSAVAEGITPVQGSRLNAVDFRAKRPMHQTVKLMDLAHWSNNLAGILGTDYEAADHHNREGVYCLRTAEVAGVPAAATTRYYFPGSGFYLPPMTFINNRIIDIYATFDFPDAPTNSVVFHVGVLIDPDGTESPADAGTVHMAYAAVTDTGLDTDDKIKLHIQIQAEGMQEQTAEIIRCRRYSSIGYNKTSAATTAEGKGYHTTFDMTVGHRIRIGVMNGSGQATDYGGGVWSSSSSNYDELRMKSLSAWMRGWNRSN